MAAASRELRLQVVSCRPPAWPLQLVSWVADNREERKIAFRQLASTRRLPELIERVRALEKEVEKLRGGA